MPKISIGVDDFDLENLRESGLTDKTIQNNGLKTKNNCLVFPYCDLEGNLDGFERLRPHQPRVIDGKAVKYTQPKGSPLRAYFPAESVPKLIDEECPVYITEGEKKALAMSQLGIAAIGLGGVWNGCNGEVLIDDLAQVNWTNRDVYIVFDYDPKPETRSQVEKARQRLGAALKAEGARKVLSVNLPPGPDGAKQGIDDFLVSQGQGQMAFGELIGRAVSVVSVVSPRQLPAIVYQGFIGEFLREVAPYTEATDAGILAHLLPAIGTLIGSGPYISTSGDRQPARINTVVVGPTSTGRKGTSRAPVNLLMRQVDAAFWEEQHAGGLSTGEGLIEKVADKRVYNKETNEYDITTVEKRLYVVEPEFSRILAQIRRDGNILSQILRESFDSGSLSVMTRSSPLRADDAHISITGHITAEELLDRFNHIEMANGFGNRFLWFAVKSDKVLPFCKPIPSSIFKKFAERLKRLSNYPNREIPLAEASMGKWKEIYGSLREEKPGFAGALAARGSSFVLRIALIYFLLDSPPRQRQGIQPQHLDAAMGVWRYCEESIQSLFGHLAGTDLGNKVQELLAVNGPLTKDQFNPHLSANQKRELTSTLEKLKASNLIRSSERKAETGRPATVWELVI